MAASSNKRNEAHTTGTFNYMKWNSELYETESPFQILIDIPKDAPDQRTTNVEFETGPPETITDVRTTLDSWSIDQHGFQYSPMNTGLSAQRFSDPDYVKEKYLPQCVSLIKKALPGAERVHFFGWRLRSSGDASSPGSSLSGNFQKPASVPHVGKSFVPPFFAVETADASKTRPLEQSMIWSRSASPTKRPRFSEAG
jgi:hypothetical protein